ncbi:MAG TPA: ATP synthase subunit I, partial [Candidatus Methylomirabilis sp.]
PHSLFALDEQATFVRATLLSAAAVGAAGVVGLALLGRWGWAASFAVGALISLGNFHLIVRAVSGLLPTAATRGAGVLWKGTMFRLAITGGVLVVALVVFRVSLPALVAGLLITQMAMITLWLMRALRSLD